MTDQRRFRRNARWLVGVPVSLAGILYLAGSNYWTPSRPVASLALVLAAIAPLWADEVRRDAPLRSSLPWGAVALLGAAFLYWRTPDLHQGAGIIMAAVTVPAAWLMAWLYRAKKSARR